MRDDQVEGLVAAPAVHGAVVDDLEHDVGPALRERDPSPREGVLHAPITGTPSGAGIRVSS